MAAIADGSRLHNWISVRHEATANREVITRAHAPQHDVRTGILSLPLAANARGGMLDDWTSTGQTALPDVEVTTRASVLQHDNSCKSSSWGGRRRRRRRK